MGVKVEGFSEVAVIKSNSFIGRESLIQFSNNKRLQNDTINQDVHIDTLFCILTC
jgi:hypothetical protein